MAIRNPIRPLDVASVASAYPKELLVNFSTGDLTILDANKNQILHKKPGTLTVKAGTTTLINAGDLSSALTLNLHAVASSGKYSDLSGTPTLHTVATSGKYTDLSGIPTLSTVASTGKYSDLIGAPTLSTVATTGAYADLTGKPTLHSVATSGSYTDLNNKPTFVSSFNGRTGAVIPASGDYTASQVGALPISGGTLSGNLAIINSNGLSRLLIGDQTDGPTGLIKVNTGKLTLRAADMLDITSGSDMYISAGESYNITLEGSIVDICAQQVSVNGAAAVQTFTTNIGTSWSGTSAPYTQSITISGIKSSDRPIMDLNLANTTYANVENISSQYSKIYRAVTAANKITFYASEKTTISIPIVLKVNRFG